MTTQKERGMRLTIGGHITHDAARCRSDAPWC